MLTFPQKWEGMALSAETSALEIEAEPMLFRADYDFARKHGGPLMHEFLDIVESMEDPARLVIDCRSHMLMRGWYPCIPGWHHDDIARPTPTSQPGYPHDQDTRFYMLVHDAGTGSMTEFLDVSEVTVPWPLPDDEPIYRYWNRYIDQEVRAPRVNVMNHWVYLFTCDDFHRGTPATGSGWRWFVRATVDSPVPPTPKIRHQVNVYLPAVTEGW